jgi:hypothetical protein
MFTTHASEDDPDDPDDPADDNKVGTSARNNGAVARVTPVRGADHQGLLTA